MNTEESLNARLDWEFEQDLEDERREARRRRLEEEDGEAWEFDAVPTFEEERDAHILAMAEARNED